MRSLSSALSTALGAPVQQPALLVEAEFSTVYRWSSFATVTWNGATWTKDDVAIDGLAVDVLRIRGSLAIGNADDVIGTLVLGEGAAGRRIRVWGYDAAATALADVVLLCDAVGGAAQITGARVVIGLRAKCEFTLAPRTFVNRQAGFTNLLPDGALLRVNGIDLRLARRQG